MKTAVFTPTRLPGGLDVNYHALTRQTRKPYVWIIGDELFSERADLVHRLPIRTHHFQAGWTPGHLRNLCASYNVALDYARRIGCDMFVSMQDYFWIPEDGLERFEAMAQTLDGHLLTGLASLTGDPPPSAIANPKGLFTIFDKPYSGKPQEIAWHDVRDRDGENGYQVRPWIEWEANYSAITPAIMATDIQWDTAYDRGVAYENQDLALRAANAYGAATWIDLDNHALGLPHKAYFPELERADAPYSNREFHEERHGLR